MGIVTFSIKLLDRVRLTIAQKFLKQLYKLNWLVEICT